MAKPLYVLLKTNNLNPILREEQNDMAFKFWKENLMNPLVFGHANYQIPLFIFVHKKKWAAYPKILWPPLSHMIL